MKTICTACLLLLAMVGAIAQVLPTASTSAQSASGQFMVFAPRQTGGYRPTAYTLSTNTSLVRLEPTMVAISAERIRQAVWRELGVTGQWQHKIFISLNETRTAEDQVSIKADRGSSGWMYRVIIPDQISKERYLRTMTRLILLELANRSAQIQTAEVPAWLSDGLAFHLISNNSEELVLTPPRQSVGGIFLSPVRSDAQRVSSLERAHKLLLGETPLSFEELSWPTAQQLDGRDSPRFLACSQLFTRRLLELRDGQACMRDLIAALPRYLNWQMAFLAAFKQHFSRPLEIEKWWALQAAEFSGRDLIQTWTYEESWNKLAAAVREPVSVHRSANDLPSLSEVSLQTIIRDWNVDKKRGALRSKMAELDFLRSRLAPELTGLAAEYKKSIELNINQRNMAGQAWAKRGAAAFEFKTPSDPVKLLDGLDSRLEKMRPALVVRPQTRQPAPPPATAFGSPFKMATP